MVGQREQIAIGDMWVAKSHFLKWYILSTPYMFWYFEG